MRVVDEIIDYLNTSVGRGGRFIDAFSGTGIVASRAADSGWPIHVNDMMYNACIMSETRLISREEATFNNLGGQEGAILTLNNLDGIDERLKSRFSQGLVLSIDKPDLETSENILKSKIPMHGLDVKDFDEEVVSFLARKFCSNVRDLEGALTRLVFYTINIKPTKHITMSVVSEAIRSLIEAHENQDELTENKIIAAVANYYSLTPSQITGKIRTSRVAMARHIAMYLDREMLGTPLIKIGQAFGGKDHSTVLSGISKVERELKNDPDMGTAISEIKSKLSK